MPQQFPTELIFAGSLWLAAIILFMIMLIATLVSLRSSGKPKGKLHSDTEPKLTSVVAKSGSKRKFKHRP